MLQNVVCVLRIALVISLLSGRTWAQGFFINQQSIRGLGRADAGNVAAANDLGTLFFNPAGMTELWKSADNATGSKLSVGIPLIIPRASLINTGSTASTPATLGTAVPVTGPDPTNPTSPTPVPSAYFAARLGNSGWYWGLAANSPFGLSEEYDSNWWGRYDSLKVSLSTYNLGSLVAYGTKKLSVGGGVEVQRAHSELTSAVPNPLVPGGPTTQTDANFAVKGTSWRVGFNGGALLKFGTHVNAPADFRVGVHYRHSIDHEIKGTAVTAGLTGILAPFNGSTGASAELNLPKIAGAGLAYEAIHSANGDKGLTVYGDYTWFGWKRFAVTRIKFDNGTPDAVRTPNFKNGFGASVGADVRLTDSIVVRGGIKIDRSPTVDGFRDTTFADDDRFWTAEGATFKLSNNISLDIAGTYVFVRDTTVDVSRQPFAGTNIRTKGDVRSHVPTVAVGIQYSR